MPRANPLSRSSYNRTFQRQRKAKLRADGKCVDCGKNDAMPSRRDPSRLGCRCSECANISAKKTKDYMDRRRGAWLDLGICVVCGKNLSIKATCHGETDTRCAVCAERQSDSRDSKTDTKRAAAWAAMLDELKLKNIGADCERRTREAA